MSDQIQKPERRHSRIQSSLLKKNPNKETETMEMFLECYGNIARHCNRVEQDLGDNSLQKMSAYTMEALQDNLKMHQSELCEASTRMKNATLGDISKDLQSLDQRTQVRLAKLIREIDNQMKINDAANVTRESIALQDENVCTASPQSRILNNPTQQECLTSRSAVTGQQEHIHQSSDASRPKQSKEKETSQLLHSTVSKTSVIESIEHLDSLFNNNRNQCSSRIGGDVSVELNTATHDLHVSKDDENMFIEGMSQCKPLVSMNRCEDKLRSNHSTSETHNSMSSSKHDHLLYQRAQLQHQIGMARQGAEQRVLEASRERIRQMDLEQDLMNMQKQIDELSHISSNPKHTTDRKDHANTDFCENPTYPETKTDIDVIAKVFADAINLNKLPVAEPAIFYGNPLEYPVWKSSFDTLIGCKRIDPGEKIHYLKRYLGGSAKSCVEGMFFFNTETAYSKARDLLEMRFGSDFAVAEAFREKLYSWQFITEKDSDGLQKFSDFLQQCEMAQESIQGLECLNDCRENRRMLKKLPDYIIVKWNRIVSEFVGYFPPFSAFASFILKEAEVACNPITSLNAVRAIGKYDKSDVVTSADTSYNNSGHEQDIPFNNSFKVQCSSVLNSKLTTNPSNTLCRYCSMNNHKLHSCRQFIALTPHERMEFIHLNRLCFACLEVGHLSKECKLRKTCKLCQRRHPTCLHGDYNVLMKKQPHEEHNESGQSAKSQSDEKIKSTEESLSLHASQTQSTSGMIVPVYLSSKNVPGEEVLTYALLDTQSDTTFVLSNIGDRVQPTKHRATLKLSTLTSTSYANCFKYNDLQVRGFNSDVQIPLPTTYSRESIPAHRSHIPTSETALQWPHLMHIHDQIPEIQSCQVGLLIGYNCPQALAPRDFICGEGNAPYAQKTHLGWSIVGITHVEESDLEVHSTSHGIICSIVSDDLKQRADVSNEVTHTCGAAIQDELNHHDHATLENGHSQTIQKADIYTHSDVQYTKLLEKHTHRNIGHYIENLMSFPSNNPGLPDNKRCIYRRLLFIEHRFKKNAYYRRGYSKVEDTVYCRTRWRLVQNLCNTFWNKLRTEHLNCMQDRKNDLHTRVLMENDLHTRVLMEYDLQRTQMHIDLSGA